MDYTLDCWLQHNRLRHDLHYEGLLPRSRRNWKFILCSKCEKYHRFKEAGLHESGYCMHWLWL